MKHLEDVPPEEHTFEDPRRKYHPVSPKAIEILIKQGWITFPIPPEQEWGLRLLQKIWGDKHKTFLRLMLADIDREERVMLAEFPRYSKIDRFVLRMLLGVDHLEQESKRGEPIQKKKYSTEDLQGIVKSYYGQHITEEEVKRLRQVAYNYNRKKIANESKARLLLTLSTTKAEE